VFPIHRITALRKVHVWIEVWNVFAEHSHEFCGVVDSLLFHDLSSRITFLHQLCFVSREGQSIVRETRTTNWLYQVASYIRYIKEQRWRKLRRKQFMLF
jgi:hypothetical protein